MSSIIFKFPAGHFMNPSLVESQFDALEEPGAAIKLDASLPPEEIARRIEMELAQRRLLR